MVEGETPMTNEELAKRIADLERELAELKAQVKPVEVRPVKAEQKPWPKYDPTEGMRMPASAVKAMVDVVPDFRGIAQEQKQMSSSGGFLGTEPRTEKKEPRRAVETPLEPPSGIKYVDQIADHFDRLDKLETMKKIADAIKAGGGK
jgi:hypothetical protein